MMLFVAAVLAFLVVTSAADDVSGPLKEDLASLAQNTDFMTALEKLGDINLNDLLVATTTARSLHSRSNKGVVCYPQYLMDMLRNKGLQTRRLGRDLKASQYYWPDWPTDWPTPKP